MAEFRWQAFFQRTAEPLFLLNRQRRLLFVNHAWETLTGLRLAQVRGRACTRRAPAVPSPTDVVTRSLAPPADVLRGQSLRVRRGGVAVQGVSSWDVDFFPFRDEQGTLAILGKIRVVSVEETAPQAEIPEPLLALRAARTERYQLEEPADRAPARQRLHEQLRLASQSRVSVLLVGEPGTGKQWLARTIHAQSAVREQTFVALDCSLLPASALETTLLGPEGLLQQPGIGSLYLREPTQLPRELQLQLTEFLAEADPTAPRLLAGSSADLLAEVRAGHLLEDFRCALSTLVLEVPPLRQRLTELPRLVDQMLERINALEERPAVTLTPEVWQCLQTYPWPGNLRELYRVLCTAREHVTGDRIGVADLPAYLRLAVGLQQTPGPATEPPLPLDQILEEVERRLIRLALQKSEGNRTRAAELLAVPRPRLWRRIEALGID